MNGCLKTTARMFENGGDHYEILPENHKAYLTTCSMICSHHRFFANRNDMAMKTDITEKDGNYTLDMELPGCKKEDIHLELNDGYLNVSASHNTSKDEKDDKGNVIRQERYSGTFSRSFMWERT